MTRGRLVSVASSSSLFARVSRGSSTHCGPKPRSRGSSPYMQSPRISILLKIHDEQVGARNIFTIAFLGRVPASTCGGDSRTVKFQGTCGLRDARAHDVARRIEIDLHFRGTGV